MTVSYNITYNRFIHEDSNIKINFNASIERWRIIHFLKITSARIEQRKATMIPIRKENLIAPSMIRYSENKTLHFPYQPRRSWHRLLENPIISANLNNPYSDYN